MGTDVLHQKTTKIWRFEMKRVIFMIVLIAILVPFTAAMADETSPYLSGTWFFDGTTYSIFAVANPTTLLLNIDAVLFAKDGTFCGCNNFQLNPNGSLDFDIFDFTTVPSFPPACQSGKGQVKLIAWLGCSGRPSDDGRCNRLNIGNATISGWDGYGDTTNGPNAGSTFNMKSVTLNPSTITDMSSIYLKCFNLLPH
jgi:hypothetical protein